MSLKDRILALCHQYATGGRVGYDDGGSITDPAGEIARELAAGSVPRNYKRVRANEALAGRELTPYLESRVADYLAREDEIKARRLEAFDAPGTAKALAGLVFPDPSTMVVPREGVESAGPDIRRRQQDQLMRGIPLSPEQEAERAAYLEALDSRRAIRANELDEGASAAGTLGAAAPFVMPGVGRGAVKGMDYVGSQIAKMPGYMQKAAPAVGGLGILGGMTAEAGGDDPRIKEIAAKEREVERIRAEIAKASKDWYPTAQGRTDTIRALEKSMISAERRIADLNTEMREDALRRESLNKEAADKEAADTKAKRQAIIDEGRDDRDKVLREANKPFSEEFPTLASYMPFAPLAAGLFTGSVMGAGRAVSNQAAKHAWDRALTKATPSGTNRLGQGTKDYWADVARDTEKSWPKATTADKLGAYAAPMAVGAVEGAIIPNLPHGYNILRIDEENPERRATQAYYRKLQGLPDENDPELLRIGKLLRDEQALPKGNPPFQAAKEYFTDPIGKALPRSGFGAFEAAGSTLPGTTLGLSMSPWERTLATRRARTKALGDKPETPTKGATPPGTPPPEPPSGPSGPSSGPTPQPNGAYQATPSPATPGPEAATPKGKPIQASVAPSSSEPPFKIPKGHNYVETGRGSKIQGPDGQWAPMPKAKATGKKLTEGKQADTDPAAEYFSDPTKLTRGQRFGGAVLDLARKYAHGGVVTHGLVPGDTGGRDDALDVDVPNGAFVVPADCVSGIAGAGNNTAAGARIWQEILPPMTGRADGGPTVPIKISDGEIVVNPEQVAALGGGDMKKGHMILEAIVKKIRAENIAHLKSLPGPARA